MSGLTRSDIDDMLRLIDASDFDELKLEIGDTKIELRRRGAATAQPTAAATSTGRSSMGSRTANRTRPGEAPSARATVA